MKKDKFVRKIETGIYELEDSSFVLVASKGKRQRKKRMPAGTSERKLRFLLAEMRAELNRDRLRVARNALAEDVDRYLDAIRGEVKFIEDRKREIRSWLPRFGHRRRDSIEPSEIKGQLREWRNEYAPHTCNLRRTALSHLYSVLDGLNAYNPVREVARFPEPAPTPKWLDYEVIRNALSKMRRMSTKARLMLMAYAGFRPSEITRAVPEDVVPFLDLAEPFCFKRVGKGDVPLMVPLPPDGVAAWKLLIERGGWGGFSQASVNKNWKIAMKSAGEEAVRAAQAAGDDAAAIEKIRLMYRPVNCYRLRHSYAVRLLLASGNKELVQKALGHANIETTDFYTQMVTDPRLVDAVRKAFGT
ncbi:MAG: tyrosine-type recombinase/integrase [Luteitalea sp.]|nr:tyrosine-type recombinase/integrase [Luteitalea sp.]